MSAENVCEHGDHPAPDGKRFCSLACQRCEHESTGENGCDRHCSLAPFEALAAELEEAADGGDLSHCASTVADIARRILALCSAGLEK